MSDIVQTKEHGNVSSLSVLVVSSSPPSLHSAGTADSVSSTAVVATPGHRAADARMTSPWNVQQVWTDRERVEVKALVKALEQRPPIETSDLVDLVVIPCMRSVRHLLSTRRTQVEYKDDMDEFNKEVQKMVRWTLLEKNGEHASEHMLHVLQHMVPNLITTLQQPSLAELAILEKPALPQRSWWQKMCCCASISNG